MDLNRFITPRRQKGFTLVELLIVVGIIALLVGILMPVLRRTREAAASVVCMNNLRQISLGTMYYAQANRDYYPGPALRSGPGVPEFQHDWIWWKATSKHSADFSKSPIVPYLGQNANSKVLICPSDAIFRTNTFAGDPPFPFSYTLNAWLTGILATPRYSVSHTTLQVKNASKTIMFAEEDERCLNDGTFDSRFDWVGIRHDRDRVTPDTFQAANMTRKGNVSFCDGHVESVTRSFAHDPLNYDPAK